MPANLNWMILVLMIFVVGCSNAAVIKPSSPAPPPTEPATFSRSPNLSK